jgi:hypothetical protein
MRALVINAEPQLNETDSFSPAALSGSGATYQPTITTLRGEATSLEAFPTLNLVSLTLILIVLDVSSALSEWQLVSGPADTGDTEGQVAPLDYNLSRNNVHWQKVGGL